MRFSDIRIVEQKLFESNRGIIGMVLDTQGGRGSSFTNDQGQAVQATNAWKFPLDDAAMRYEPEVQNPNEPAEMPGPKSIDQQFKDELATVKTGDGTVTLDFNSIKWAGGQKPGTGFAALVVELTSKNGRTYVGKYFPKKRVDGHIFWQVSDFVRDMAAAGIKLNQKKAATSKGADGSINLGPREVGVTGSRLDINNVIATLKAGVMGNAKIPQDEQNSVVEMVENLGGQPVTINPSFKANYEVQLGEVAAPIALARGILASGDYLEAEQKLLSILEPGLKWQGITAVEYPESITEKLVDSYVYSAAGTKIGISSKDKKGGAAASISSITETLENKLDVIKERVPRFEKEFKFYIDIVNIMKQSTGQKMAFDVAAYLDIITPEVAAQAYDLVMKKPGDVAALQAIDGGNYYNTMINWTGYNPNTAHAMYKASYHATASLARMCAIKMNEDASKTKRFFSTVLESANMVQVLTSVKLQGDQAAYSNFQVIYPPVFDGSIKFEAGSYYYATQKPAGFTFKIK